AAFEARVKGEGVAAGFAEGAAKFATSALGMGATPAALRAADKALALTGDANVPWQVPFVYYFAGRTQQAAGLQAMLSKRYAAYHMFVVMGEPLMTAAAAMQRGQHRAALDALGPAAPYERSHPEIALLRGRALFGDGRFDEAAVAFQKTIDNRFVAEPSPLGTVATIWLARARAKLGEAAGGGPPHPAALAG